ncbi:MAG: hypothetical protein ACJAYU_004833 [Bradymonadia bacterium]|jgi:hypothetical protein
MGLYFEDPERTYISYFWEIAQAGADTVSLVTSWSQPTIRANEVSPSERTPNDDEVRRAIRDARSLGLDVILLPILQIDERADGEWRGVLAPDDVSAWFESYRAFVVHYAALAQEEGVTLLSIGSELGSMEVHESEWSDLIGAVRSTFSGQLTYSANWDHFHRTPFWDALDLAGTTAYYELSAVQGENPTVEELVVAWAPFLESVGALAETIQKPVLITEIGYVSQTGASWHPWDYTTTGDADLVAQRDLYEAFYRVAHDLDCLGGVVFWTWFGDGGSADDGYTPRGKPAEQIIRHWFGAEVSGQP